MQIAASDQTQSSNAGSGLQRQAWMDFARGLGVILVVYGHVLDGLMAAHIFPKGPLGNWMIYTLYTFHMPLFFFLAGLNVQHSLQRGAGPFLWSKVWTIAYPYVLWSLIQGGIIMMFAGNANHPLDPSDLAAIWYRPIAQFWFLYALMICQILAVLVPSRTAMILIAAVGVVIFQLLPSHPDLALTLHHLPFFVAGIYTARFIMTRKIEGKAGFIALFLICLTFAAAAAAGGVVSDMDWNALASLPACILGIAAIVILCKLLSEKRHRWLAHVGLMSMTIYVMHILASSGVRIAMLKLHVPTQPWLYLFVGVAVGVLVPMIAHVILQRLRLLPLFGLAPPAKRKPAPASLVGQTTASD
jgi:fucose 4-O-acetylase-like acetyltransferase